MQSVLITTTVVSSNHAHGEVYSIQQYVVRFVSDVWQVGVFISSSGIEVSFTNKIDRHFLSEILLKVVLNTTTLTAQYQNYKQNDMYYTKIPVGIFGKT